MYEIGRICLKIAGRDSSKKCVVIDVLDKGYVLIDGETRRKKCNILHLEPTEKVIEISKNAAHDQVVAAFKTLGIEIKAKKGSKKAAPRPVKKRKVKAVKSETKNAKAKKPKK